MHVVDGGQFLERRHHQALRVAFADSALRVGDLLGEQAGPMEIEVRVEILGAEGIDRRGEALRDVGRNPDVCG